MSTNDQALNDGSLFASFDIDKYHLIPTNAKVHRIKVHRYKEIKHYIKGEVLGRGQFGTVREFVDKYTLQRYAGKIIRKWVLKRNEYLCEAINKELAISYHFDHPNVLRVYDLFVASHKIYMFMEFCYGELSEFMTFHPSLHKCQSKDFFGQICEGLDYLHSRGIIHRDIKPENVLVSYLNQLKLADFGVCESVDIFSENDMVVGSDGSPFYHSPEVSDRNVLGFSGSKVDIWAAALILLHMITGFEFCNKFVLNPQDNIHYPSVIQEDILLHDLFNKLFKKDFRERISIAEIRKHSWMQIKCSQVSEHYKTFPTERRNVDCYRGLTVMTRIHEKFFPSSISETDKLVDEKAREESKKPLPLFRSNRLTATKRKADIQPARINFNS